MRFFCRFGIHRWEYREHYVQGGPGRALEVIEARCRNRCERYGKWSVVHREWHRRP